MVGLDGYGKRGGGGRVGGGEESLVHPPPSQGVDLGPRSPTILSSASGTLSWTTPSTPVQPSGFSQEDLLREGCPEP